MKRWSGPDRCPDSEGGTHHPIDEGYSPLLRGRTIRCTCGYVLLFPTDEMASRDSRLLSWLKKGL